MIKITFLLLKVEINKLVPKMCQPYFSELTSSNGSISSRRECQASTRRECQTEYSISKMTVQNEQCMKVDEQICSSSGGTMADGLVEDHEETLVVEEIQLRADGGDTNEVTSEADTFLQGLKEKKLKNRIKLENLKPSTSEYLDQSQPANTKAAVQTAITALETVIKQIRPEEERKLEEMPEEDLAEYLEQFFKCVVK